MYKEVAAGCVMLAVSCALLVRSNPLAANSKLVFRAHEVPFVLRNSATPAKHQIETMVGGVAVLDADGDGLLDIFFVNGARQPDLAKSEPGFHNRLFRNKGGFEWEDITARAGVAGYGYDIAAAAGDYDNDGRTDLYVTGVNRDLLYRNRGDGSFEEVTRQAGLDRASPAGTKPWAVSAGWLDYDRDGWLDLFISNYVIWDPKSEPFCGDPKMTYRTYCHPKYYAGLPNTLYRNNRDGTFVDVTADAGLSRLVGKGMGIAFADYDRDGHVDIFVANDTVPNFLLRNEGNGRFTEAALKAGVAFNDDGRALSSMGADFRDVDNDGLPDLFVSALTNETFPLYRNSGRGLFVDLTYPTRLGTISLPFSGWSNGIYDLDNDGRKDLIAACGDVQDNTEVYSSRKSRQPNLVLRNAGTMFQPVIFGQPAQHRGMAVADFNNDGRLDAVMSRIGEPAVVYENLTEQRENWLGLRLRGNRSNRDGLGAEVRIVTAAGEQWNHATTAVGYASSSDPRVHFGLGANAEAKLVEVRWTSGPVQRLENVKAGRYVEVREP